MAASDPWNADAPRDDRWFVGEPAPRTDAQGAPSFASQLADGAFIGRGAERMAPIEGGPALSAMRPGPVAPLPSLTDCYGRGTGWSDNQWRRFDEAQQAEATKQAQASSRLRAAATAVESGTLGKAERSTLTRFESTVGLGDATPERMRAAADLYDRNVAALRAGVAQGKVANGLSPEEWAAQVKDPDALAAARHGSNTMLVNLGHPAFGDDAMLRWAAGHEPFHGESGLADETINGIRAYKYDHDGKYLNQLRFQDPVRSTRNPDSLMDFAN